MTRGVALKWSSATPSEAAIEVAVDVNELDEEQDEKVIDSTTWHKRPCGRAPLDKRGNLMVWNHNTASWAASFAPLQVDLFYADDDLGEMPPPPPDAEEMATDNEGPNKMQLPYPVTVLWPGDKQWYEGVVDRVRVEKTGNKRRLHHITYSDGDK